MKLFLILRRIRRQVTLNNAAVAFALLVAFGWTWGTVTSLQKNFTLQQQVDAMDQEIALLELETQSLGLQSSYYRSDEYKELMARAKLGKANAGERLVILPPQPVVEQTAATFVDTTSPSNFEQWVRFFFGRKS